MLPTEGVFEELAVFFLGFCPRHQLCQLNPTIFFRKSKGKLVEICELVIPFQTNIQNGSAHIQLGKETFAKTWTSGKYDFGVLTEPVEIPARLEASTVSVEVGLGGPNRKTTHPFVPAKQWKIYICPKVHNDVGYTDLQPHVNELDNRNSDQVLDILREYPFYKFNFETSWLVENYLDCRTPPWPEQFFDFAKRNRIGINTLYLNLLTGLCSGAELYRAMYFTHMLHREQGSDFDFACLTDAPSHTWFLPSLLAEAGIQGFALGSNQARAPLLQNSNLNEDSPFYWEGADGRRARSPAVG